LKTLLRLRQNVAPVLFWQKQFDFYAANPNGPPRRYGVRARPPLVERRIHSEWLSISLAHRIEVVG